ncbi:MAG: oxygen-independent coproporphyrinogen III oxidase [Pseudomonadota bacterium]
MKEEWRRYLDVRAPRYTSYPTALKFTDEIGPDEYADKLAGVGPYEPLSVYVHVPFCRQLCWYCGCNMRVENDYSRALDYVEALIAEIRAVGRRLGGRGRPVSVHFGGGTPNYLLVDELAAVLSAIESEFGLTDDAQIAIELDPRLLRDDDPHRLAELGFERMSLGIQDFDPEVQEAINRVQSYDLIEACVGAIRAAGVSDLSFDVLYGLPKQTAASFEATIDRVVALNPDRVSVFGYAHLPSVLTRQRVIRDEDLPDGALRAALADHADRRLTEAGYLRIGFDHYAKPGNALAEAMRRGRLRRNFQGFTDDVADTTIGLGASAIGFVGGLYAQNEKDLRRYAELALRGDLPTARGVMRSDRDELVATSIGDLLCRFEVDLGALQARLPDEARRRMERRINELAEDRVITRTNGLLRINPDAYALARVAAMALDPDAPSFEKVSSAV